MYGPHASSKNLLALQGMLDHVERRTLVKVIIHACIVIGLPLIVVVLVKVRVGRAEDEMTFCKPRVDDCEATKLRFVPTIK